MKKNEQAGSFKFIKNNYSNALIFIALGIATFFQLSILLEESIIGIFRTTTILDPIIFTYPDKFSFIWNFWWIKEALINNTSIFYTNKLFSPNGTSLYLHTLFPFFGIILNSLFISLTATTKYKIAICSIYILNTFSAYLLFNYLSRCWLKAFTLSLLICFQPYLFAHAVAGHLNLISIFESLLFILFFFKFRETNKNIYLAFIFLILIITPFISLNYFYFIFIFLLLFYILNLRNIKKQDFKLLITITLSLSTLSPYLLKIINLFKTNLFTENHNPLKHSANFIHFLIPNTYQTLNKFLKIDNSFFKLDSAESSLYLGLGLILLTLLALPKIYKNNLSLKMLIVSLVFFTLSLGPKITFNNLEILNFTPYKIFSYLPAFPSVPARFMIFGFIFLIVALSKIKINKTLFITLTLITLIEYIPSYKGYTFKYTDYNLLSELKNKQNIKNICDVVDHDYGSKLRQIVHNKNICSGFIARKNKSNLKFLRKNNFYRLINGKRFNKNKLVADFKLLEIDGVLINNNQEKILKKIKELKLLNKIIVGKEISFIYYGIFQKSLPK